MVPGGLMSCRDAAFHSEEFRRERPHQRHQAACDRTPRPGSVTMPEAPVAVLLASLVLSQSRGGEESEDMADVSDSTRSLPK